MKTAHLLYLLLLSTVVVAPVALAQQPRTRPTHERGTRQRGQRVDPRAANATYQVLEFNFTTGDDDLRQDSGVRANLVFADGSKLDCPLHGPGAAGNDATVGWGNNSGHLAAPCHLDKPRTLADLKGATMKLNLIGLPPTATFDPMSWDNWNINAVRVNAYNPQSPSRTCVLRAQGKPLVRLTGDSSSVTITDFPNQCH